MGLNLYQKQWLDKWLGKAQVVFAGTVVFFGAALATTPDNWGVTVSKILNWMQTNAWWVVFIGPILVASIQFFRRKFCNPWAMDAIQKLLNEFQEEVFGGLDDPVDYHKVTLFKKRGTNLLSNPFSKCAWCGWLVPVARSEHLSKKRIEKFKAPDQGEHCKGVVGNAWRHRGWVQVPASGEEPLPTISSDSSEEDFRNYAERTGVNAEWVQTKIKGGKTLSQSYAALKIQLAGEPWGVLVLDSRSGDMIDPEKLKKFRAYGNLMTPMLERL